MTELRFDAERHSSLVAVMRTAVELIRQHLDALDRETDQLRSEWSGAAQDAYASAHAAWAAEMDALHELLARAAVSASHASEVLQRTEAAAAAIWT